MTSTIRTVIHTYKNENIFLVFSWPTIFRLEIRLVGYHNKCQFPSGVKPKFHLARHVTSRLDTTRHNTFDVEGVGSWNGVSTVKVCKNAWTALRTIFRPKCSRL